MKVGDKIRVTGIGKMFVDTVQGSSGEGTIVHIGRDGVIENVDFKERDQYKKFFPEQYNDGIFYIDSGTGQALWIERDDCELID